MATTKINKQKKIHSFTIQTGSDFFSLEKFRGEERNEEGLLSYPKPP